MRKVDILKRGIIGTKKYPGVFLDKANGVASRGEQWFASGLMTDGDYILEDEVLLFSITSNNGDGQWLFGARKEMQYTVGVFIGKNGVYNGYGGTTYNNRNIPEINTWLNIYFSRKKFTIGTRTYTVNGGNLVPSEHARELLIGRIDMNYLGTAEDLRLMDGRRRRLRITDAVTLELLRDYRAFLHDDGRYGFWDMVHDTFSDSLGSPFEP